MHIKRDSYLKQLIQNRHNGYIKVITGIRRCGKSYLLNPIFSSWLKEQGIDDSHIIRINLEDRRNKWLRDPDELLKYIDGKLIDRNMHYVMIDEIQHVNEFEDVLNSYLGMNNVDVYVTGSNSKFLSKDVITTFRGRSKEIYVYPLSFSEYFPIAVHQSKRAALNEYMKFGGMPQAVLEETDQEKQKVLKTLFRNTYIKDIAERYNIKNIESLNELINVIASGIGSLTNPNKIVNTFESVKHVKLSRPTVGLYLDYLTDAFIIDKAERYDIKGKAYIDSSYKYYFTDCGLRNARLNFRQLDYSHLMENVIYNELKRLGYNVDVGVVPIRKVDKTGNRVRTNLEVDFVCNEGDRRLYIQSAYRIPDEEKLIQEEASLRNIDDTFKKVIIIADEFSVMRTNFGTTVISIYDFLLNEGSLDL